MITNEQKGKNSSPNTQKTAGSITIFPVTIFQLNSDYSFHMLFREFLAGIIQSFGDDDQEHLGWSFFLQWPTFNDL
jgi:hypothetical protein